MTIEHAERLRLAALAAMEQDEKARAICTKYAEKIERGDFVEISMLQANAAIKRAKQTKSVLDQAMNRYKQSLIDLGIDVNAIMNPETNSP